MFPSVMARLVARDSSARMVAAALAERAVSEEDNDDWSLANCSGLLLATNAFASSKTVDGLVVVAALAV